MDRRPVVGVGGKVRNSCGVECVSVGGGWNGRGRCTSVRVQVARESHLHRSQNSITTRGSSSLDDPRL
jgi:hypothetical protein